MSDGGRRLRQIWRELSDDAQHRRPFVRLCFFVCLHRLRVVIDQGCTHLIIVLLEECEYDFGWG